MIKKKPLIIHDLIVVMVGGNHWTLSLIAQNDFIVENTFVIENAPTFHVQLLYDPSADPLTVHFPQPGVAVVDVRGEMLRAHPSRGAARHRVASASPLHRGVECHLSPSICLFC